MHESIVFHQLIITSKKVMILHLSDCLVLLKLLKLWADYDVIFEREDVVMLLQFFTTAG